MAGLNNFYRHDVELIGVYRRFGTRPFFYKDVADLVSKQAQGQLINWGYWVVHENRLAGRIKTNRWRLPAAVAERCEQALQEEEAACSSPA